MYPVINFFWAEIEANLSNVGFKLKITDTQRVTIRYYFTIEQRKNDLRRGLDVLSTKDIVKQN